MKKPQSHSIFDDSDFPISIVRKTIFQGTGTDMEEAGQKPLIAVASSQTDINPGHMHLQNLALRVKEGVHAAGGLPFEFNVPAPCDGITEGHEGMRYVLAQRDLIADMIETHVRSMRYDGIVFIAGCDKIIPGMLMAAARLDLPSIFLTGGPNSWSIRHTPQMNGSVNHQSYDGLEAKMSCATAATCGSCEVMGTANTFQCIAEALGMTLPGSSNVPAFLSEKLTFARKTGMRIVSLVEEGVNARQVLNQKSLLNAVMVDLAIGGSTNSTLHLPALARAMELELPLETFNEYSAKIPTLTSIAPNGPHGIIDLHMAGGVQGVMKMLEEDLNTEAMTVAGGPLKDVLAFATVKDAAVIRPKDNPYLAEGGTAALFGSLAPEGSVIKQSAVIESMRVFTGKARVFESEHDALKAVREETIREGDVVVIRNEGPKGGPGMPETLAVTMGLDMAGYKQVALITDGRFSGATSGPCIGHVSPEAAAGGPIAMVENGDEISIDIPARKLDLLVSKEELEKRRANWKPVQREIPPGYMRRYVKLVSSAAKGAVLD
ncbi:dihydroxy-acid dehydratase [Desulfatibacillum aliphaticivorans]|uniref:dihydroxy-acid dehydratase n=1 Tax=Desulfatibacillum aliphaticivorans TaxID=218208 RepID=UPI00040B11E0|nr:dihydroxy-acid dehydratase [Desulfatibacillum aliphaticivorans]